MNWSSKASGFFYNRLGKQEFGGTNYAELGYGGCDFTNGVVQASKGVKSLGVKLVALEEVGEEMTSIKIEVTVLLLAVTEPREYHLAESA